MQMYALVLVATANSSHPSTDGASQANTCSELAGGGPKCRTGSEVETELGEESVVRLCLAQSVRQQISAQSIKVFY